MPHIDRDEAIKRIRVALRRRSGKAWSVTKGLGTSSGWITVAAPPARRTADFGYTSPEECDELARLFGVDRVHHQGESISPDSRAWYVERAEKGEPSTLADDDPRYVAEVSRRYCGLDG